MIIYDLILLLLTLFVSIKKPHHFRRLFEKIPDPKGKEVIWIHAVSVGEAKSVKTLFTSLRSAYPSAYFLVTTTTATGQEEARRSLAGADAFTFLPIDLRWVVGRWVKRLSPKLFILVETDFWPNLLSFIKKLGGKTVLVSGKLSERSANRFALVPFFAKKLFNLVDHFFVQTSEDADRFRSYVEPDRIHIGGNLKLDYSPTQVDTSFFQEKIGLTEPAITLSCTHAPEEEELLDRLPLDRYFFFLVPRHPERFEEVAQILEKKKIFYFRWSRLAERRGGERVLLVDAMGQLPICYSLSRLAVVAGSFQPHVGGHNILEPCFYGIAVFFGPYMFSQKELVSKVLAAGAGKQVDYSAISAAINTFFSSSEEAKMCQAARGITESCRGASHSIFQKIQTFLQKV